MNKRLSTKLAQLIGGLLVIGSAGAVANPGWAGPGAFAPAMAQRAPMPYPPFYRGERPRVQLPWKAQRNLPRWAGVPPQAWGPRGGEHIQPAWPDQATGQDRRPVSRVSAPHRQAPVQAGGYRFRPVAGQQVRQPYPFRPAMHQGRMAPPQYAQPMHARPYPPVAYGRPVPRTPYHGAPMIGYGAPYVFRPDPRFAARPSWTQPQPVRWSAPQQPWQGITAQHGMPHGQGMRQGFRPQRHQPAAPWLAGL